MLPLSPLSADFDRGKYLNGRIDLSDMREGKAAILVTDGRPADALLLRPPITFLMGNGGGRQSDTDICRQKNPSSPPHKV